MEDSRCNVTSAEYNYFPSLAGHTGIKKKNKKIISINTLCHLFSHHDTNILDEGKKKNNQTKTNANSMLEHYLN